MFWKLFSFQHCLGLPLPVEIKTTCLQLASTDTELWYAFKQGDRESFGLLFRRFYPLLFQYGNKLCPDENLVEDSIQELFLELWQSNSDVRPRSVKAYLLQALKYKIYNQARGKSRASEISDDLLFEISHENFLINNEDEKRRAGDIVHALKQLSNRQREIIYLKLFQELSYEELTEAMQINYQVARNLFYEAINSLRKALNQAAHS